MNTHDEIIEILEKIDFIMETNKGQYPCVHRRVEGKDIVVCRSGMGKFIIDRACACQGGPYRIYQYRYTKRFKFFTKRTSTLVFFVEEVFHPESLDELDLTKYLKVYRAGKWVGELDKMYQHALNMKNKRHICNFSPVK